MDLPVSETSDQVRLEFANGNLHEINHVMKRFDDHVEKIYSRVRTIIGTCQYFCPPCRTACPLWRTAFSLLVA